jgi:mRNA guanylyltransferase
MYIILNESENPIKQECYLIDRKNKYYSVDLSFYNAQSQLLNDTLIDGELVMDRDGTVEIWRFLAFDLLMVNGEMKVDRNLEKRLGALYEFVVKPYNKHLKQCLPEYVQSRPFTIEMKKVEKCYHLKEILASIKSLKHENDGLLFTSVDRPYDFGTCDSMLKWKPSSHNSVDFKVLFVISRNIMIYLFLRLD